MACVSFELLGVIVRESLDRYECVPLRDLLREYNARCVLGGRVRCLMPCHLVRALSLVGGGEVCYRRSGLLWGVVRNEDIKPSVANQLLTQKFEEATGRGIKVVQNSAQPIGKNYHTGIVLEVWNGAGGHKVDSE
jgi:hypothetical protein